MKLLVTGGAGFIGSNFIHYVFKKYPNYKIVNLDALTYAGCLDNLKEFENDSRYTFVHGSICNRELVDSIMKDIDIVVNFAAESHVDRSIENPQEFIMTNIVGTYTLLESALRHNKKRFHHISTDEVYGQLSSTDKPFSEKTPYDPRSPYSASKASSDHLVSSYFHTYNLPITISNCSNNYGPYHFPEKLIPLAITNILTNKKIPIYGDGSQIRDWLHVEDHCRAIDLIVHKGKIGETYCIGGDSEYTNKNLLLMILKIMKKEESVFEYVKDRLGHDKRYAIDFSKIKNELGWKPEIEITSGLQKTIKWYEKNVDWWKNKK
ncbi:MAG: dTDP-glucose 4,6-dehydratase [Minisyncoccia bacterium]